MSSEIVGDSSVSDGRPASDDRGSRSHASRAHSAKREL